MFALRTRFLILAPCLAATVLGGCGGDSASDTAAAVSKAKADQIVADAKAQAQQIKDQATAQAAKTTQATKPVSASAGGSSSSSSTTGSGTHGLPNLVGKGLQFAQDASQARGFYNLTSHDASGRGRMQIYDRNWKVCTQKPSPGSTNKDATVDLGAVKNEESCPSSDQGNQPVKKAGATMPNLVGKSASVAEDALPNASITYDDGLGEGRTLIIASNWHICKQEPSAGSSYDGVPVTLTVVKYGEDC